MYVYHTTTAMTFCVLSYAALLFVVIQLTVHHPAFVSSSILLCPHSQSNRNRNLHLKPKSGSVELVDSTYRENSTNNNNNKEVEIRTTPIPTTPPPPKTTTTTIHILLLSMHAKICAKIYYLKSTVKGKSYPTTNGISHLVNS